MNPPNLPGWDNVEIVRLFEEHYGVKATLRNDANASAMAEWKFGAGKGCENMIFLTFGTGLGAGLILNGSFYICALFVFVYIICSALYKVIHNPYTDDIFRFPVCTVRTLLLRCPALTFGIKYSHLLKVYTLYNG